MPQKFIRQTHEIPVLFDVICDRCHTSCKKSCDYEFATIKATWGYDSNKDCEKHVSYLCEQCYDEVLKIACIKPAITNHL